MKNQPWWPLIQDAINYLGVWLAPQYLWHIRKDKGLYDGVIHPLDWQEWKEANNV